MGYDPCARRKLGSAPIEITQLGLGCGPLGGFRGAIAEDEAQAILHTAYDAGVRLFDTAPLYGYGRSELRVGQALRQLPRESFVLSTKVGRWLEPLRPDGSRAGWRAGGLEFLPTYDLSHDGVMRALEQSHCRLGLATIDIVLIHDVDLVTHGGREAFEQRYREALEGAYPALARLREDGVIKAVGIGVNEVEPCLRLARDADLDCILLAGRYTLLEQGALDELLPLCLEKRIGILVGGPYNSGILATGPGEGATYDYQAAPPEVRERVRRIDAVCRRHGMALATAALQFPLAHPAISALIPGAVSRAEVLQNVSHLRVDVPADLWAELKHEGLLHGQAPVPA
ncbi:MAG TPA: aldo/keto reductase [Geminicoccaceae bacterium]|nr:aldo/keto reductase [Geminicoccaceae bacterium]